MSSKFDYDLFVIGGGSSGLSAAKAAARYGARVAIAEPAFLGGTCVARGCIPKKLMVYASEFSRLFEDATAYGWSQTPSQFSWTKLVAAVNSEIRRLDQLHRAALDKAKITLFSATAAFDNPHKITVGSEQITADHVLIAVGGKPIRPKTPGVEHALVSDDMFHLSEQPRRLTIVGGGYIGVEFAGIMQGLGTQVTQIVRESEILEKFDEMLQSEMQKGMIRHGVSFLFDTEVTNIELTAAGLQLSLSNSSKQTVKQTVDAILMATGRAPNLEALKLENAGVKLNQKAVEVNEESQTSQPNIYAVGDCTDRVQLTPVAIAEGKAFADTLFGHRSDRVSYKNIPSSVFGKPQAAYVGLTEAEAKQQFGADQIVTYCTTFTPLFHSLTDRDETTSMKLVVEKSSARLLGAHMIGNHAAEIMQSMAIAVSAGLTKADIDATMPLHPTSAEEFVTLKLTSMPEQPVPPCWMQS
ncbi:MAG: glutathione-disulfide reductase [Pegethrix bostrychoides GSE-TBD4-15B]|jgi:glutathione reductase (NADPH)|uniref:Glutathione-disulfide reductase n=1 Tax=Pegethrix bostrychoides GSE-TBD4-15B TaxID=2839662 RepID=A0A951PAB7_9CYAN|nr:glutathione-disulfide reductase [Pegethrix bostrychoides GSE-TBD4-15B]